MILHMALTDLWTKSKDELSTKQVQQIIAIAGEGRLRDGNSTSAEFRHFLAAIPSELVARYAAECIATAFTDSGLTLQDLVNQIGVRLGFDVTFGRYRGMAGRPGFDGLWRSPGGHALVVEVKTTDAYRIDLNTVAGYRRALIEEGLSEEQSSILFVVGRQDTGDLEAQIRGSRHAWDVRLISIDALIRLMLVKEALEDPSLIRRIHQILVPREFTRLDEIVDILFTAAEDLRQDTDDIPPSEGDDDADADEKKFTPVAFHAACVERISAALGKSFVKHSRAAFYTPDDAIRLICAVSREHHRAGQRFYWFAFHPHQGEFAAAAPAGYVAFGCGTPANVLLIPFEVFSPWLEGMNVTALEDRHYRHVQIVSDGRSFTLLQRKGAPRIDLTGFLLPL